MKKKFITLFTALTLLAGTTFANTTTEPTKEIKTEFSHFFAGATDVKWQVLSNFYIATFKQGDQYLMAYFNPAGRIEAVSRNISTTALPLLLQKNLQAKMQNSWISEVAELANKNGTAYYITLENANTKTMYQASGNDWAVYKTANK